MHINLPPKATQRAFERLAEINPPNSKALRVAVAGGGCSGFQYDITLEDFITSNSEDFILEQNGQRIIIDKISLPFLYNAIIDFSEELIGQRFIIENPNASSSCGCGLSFSL